MGWALLELVVGLAAQPMEVVQLDLLMVLILLLSRSPDIKEGILMEFRILLVVYLQAIILEAQVDQMDKIKLLKKI